MIKCERCTCNIKMRSKRTIACCYNVTIPQRNDVKRVCATQSEFSAEQRCQAVRQKVYVWCQWGDVLEFRPGNAGAISNTKIQNKNTYFTTNIMVTMVTVLGRIPVGCFGVPTASKSDGAATAISRRIFGKKLQVRRFLSTLLETFLSDKTFKTNLP